MSTPTNRLSTDDHWQKRWAQAGEVSLDFDPNQISFREIHELLKAHLPSDKELRFLEVGCYPGRFLAYFRKQFGYHVSGLEYVESCCNRSRQLLTQAGVDAEVIHADLFSFTPPSNERWDVVGSFGFIEHFENTADVVARHLALLKPRGLLILTAPNHFGINGKILRKISPEKYAVHNQMSYTDLLAGVRACANVEIIEGGYFGRLGFWNTGTYAAAATYGRKLYLPVRTSGWVLEKMGQVLPNSSLLSPNIAIVARKLSD